MRNVRALIVMAVTCVWACGDRSPTVGDLLGPCSAAEGALQGCFENTIWECEPGTGEWKVVAACQVYENCYESPDGALECCQPTCGTSECGHHCGLDCGSCPEGHYCDVKNSWGRCRCEQRCAYETPGGLECGEDGCGGNCGDCPEGWICVDHYCSCVPLDCSSRECGSDGCEGYCGLCSADKVCDDGTCVIRQCEDANDDPWDGCHEGLQTPFVVNSYRPDYQRVGDIAAWPGGFLAVWSSGGGWGWPFGHGNGGDDGPDGALSSICGSRITGTGEVGEEFIVTTTSEGDQYEPAVARGDTTFAVAWASAVVPYDDERKRNYGDRWVIRARVLPDDGTTAFDEVHVAGEKARPFGDGHVDPFGGPSILHLGEDQFLVTWDESGDGIFARELSGAESSLGEPYMLVGPVYSMLDSITVAAGEHGIWVVYFSADDAVAEDYVLRGRRIDPADNSVLAETVFAQDAPNSAVWFLTAQVVNMSAVSTASGGIALAWKTTPSPGDISIWRVVFRSFDSMGQPISETVEVESEPDLFGEGPSIERMSDGSIVVCWLASHGGTDASCPRCRPLSSSGLPLGPAVCLLDEGYGIGRPGSTGGPTALAALSSGEVVVLWGGSGVSEYAWDIFGYLLQIP
jgi:hypothetical protein